jgi:hypothetical protein
MRFLIIPLLFISFLCSAAESDYDYCYIAGYFSGSDQVFYMDLAVKKADNNNVMGTPLCVSAWKEAFEIGIHVSATGNYRNKTDKRVSHLAAKFKDKILSNISNK